VFQKYLGRWDDANQLAGASTRVSLNGPVATLQSVRRDAQAEPWPDCATNTALLMDQAMKTEIDAYVTWMSIDYSNRNPACKGLSEYECSKAVGEKLAQEWFNKPAVDKFTEAKSKWTTFEASYAKITGRDSGPGASAGQIG
jgi:hypothetical protein